jgi:hypothetical protein
MIEIQIPPLAQQKPALDHRAEYGRLEQCQTAQAPQKLNRSPLVSSRSLMANHLTAGIQRLLHSVGAAGLKAGLLAPKSSPRPSLASSPAMQLGRGGKQRKPPETVSSVPYWGMLVHPKDGHSRVFCVLHAYLDESGIHSGSRICVVAGYFGSERQWNRFDVKWRNVLDSFAIEHFHANRFWAHVNGSNVSEFRGWDDTKCREFIRSLLGVIESYRVYPVGCSVNMEEWRKLTTDERAFLTGATYDDSGKLLASGAPNKTYFLPFLTTIADALDCCNWGHLMHFTFASNEKFSGYALQYFQQVKKTRQENYKKMGEIFFADSRRAAPLQAADLLAYEIYQHGIRRLESKGARVNPTLAMVLATQNIRKPRKSIPIWEGVAFERSLRSFRRSRGEGPKT